MNNCASGDGSRVTEFVTKKNNFLLAFPLRICEISFGHFSIEICLFIGACS